MGPCVVERFWRRASSVCSVVFELVVYSVCMDEDTGVMMNERHIGTCRC